MNKVESFQLSEGNKVSIDLGLCGYGFEGPATVIIVKEAADVATSIIDNEQIKLAQDAITK